MPADDTLLGQNLVDERNEERKPLATMWFELPLTFCTSDDYCAAEADQHFDSCPVEQRLKEVYGF